MTRTITMTSAARANRRGSLLLAWTLASVLAVGWGGCGSPAAETHDAETHDAETHDAETHEAENWSVTAWGETFEVFPEIEPLVEGETAMAHTHVTRLDGFTPLVDGAVEIVLSGPSGEQLFGADQPVRPGIFAVEITPDASGERELSFRIRGPEGSEEIAGGTVRIGTVEEPGGLVVGPTLEGATDGGEPLSFLKEEQWRTRFATVRVRTGNLARAVSGLARVRPPAGGEASVTSPVDGVLHPASGARSWPFVGRRVERGAALFRVVPHVAADRSLPTLEAEVATLATELATAGARLSRLEELLALEATSQREIEEARVRVETLEARQSAARRDLDAARSSREGGAGGDGLLLRASFGGEIAEISTSPGATVSAGDPLARLVRTDVVWLEVLLPPAGARQIAREGVRGVVLTDPESEPIRLEEGVRLVSVAPELSPRTGTVTVLLETPPGPELVLGTTLQAQVLSNEERAGVVIPASALVDDGGVPVVYLQLSGESFLRQEIKVIERQGDRLLVEGLTPGQRLVTLGGDAIRRSSLMAGGDVEGHVH